jgi:HK97 family phage major capsid protein
MSEQYKTLNEKAMSCLHLARAINDRYPDPATMPAEEVANRKALLVEGKRLRDLAEIQRQQDELEGWAAGPAEDHPAVKAMAASNDSVADVAQAVAGANKQLQAKAFLKWMQGKDRTVEEKAALVENTAGEVIVPPDLAGPIFKELPHLGTFRGAGPTIRPTTSDRVSLRSLTGATAGWNKLETGGTPVVDANVVTNSPADTISVWDLLALSQVGVDELADTDVANLPGLIQQIVGLQFAQMEDDAFANGTGTSQPFGLAMRATQASPLITQQVTAAANNVLTGDDLKSLPYKVPTVFRPNGAYFASDAAAQAIALLKDSTSNYLWQPSVRAGEPETLFGRRFYTLEGLPAMTGATAADPVVIFGDPALGYMVADRQQVTMQRLDERYAELGLVGFLFKLRVGGDVMRPKAFAKYLV